MRAPNSGLERELPWEQRPYAELFRLAWPMAVSVVSYSLMTLCDTLFVARLGAAALAGVGLGGVMSFALICFSFGLLRGVKVLAAQSVGAGRPEEQGAYLGAGLVLAVAMGIVIALVAQIFCELLPLISDSAAAGAVARDYLAVRMLGAPMALVYVAFREKSYGVGDSRGPMVAVVVANVTNALLCWLFIYGLDMGPVGAAWATVVGQTVEALLLVWLGLREGLGIGRTRLEHVRAVFRLGVPTGLQFLLEVGSFSALSIMIAAMSDVQMAAHQIAIQVIHFTFLPCLAVADATSVMAGQAVGARRDELVRSIAWRGLFVTWGYALACTAVLALGGRFIAGQFTSETDVVSVAARLLAVAAIFQLADAAQIVGGAVLRGTGDVRYPAMVGVTVTWLCTPPLTWLLGWQAGLGALGGWIGLTLDLTLVALLLWWRLARGGWREAADRLRADREEVELAPAE